MMRAACLAVLVTVWAAPAVVDAQEPEPEDAAGLAEPEPGHRARRGMPRATPRPEREPRSRRDREEEGPWDGPRVELGWTHYVIVDGFGGGDVHSAVFGGYLPTGRARLHANAELGSRDYSIGQAEAVVRGNVLLGYQHLPTRPFVPYAGVVGTFGVILGKRFHTPITQTLGGLGLEVGADLNLVRTLHTGVGLAYVRASLAGTGYDLFVLRLRIGL